MSGHRAARRARSSFVSTTTGRWITAYLVVVLAAAVAIAASGVSPTPNNQPEAEQALSPDISAETRVASVAPSLDQLAGVSHRFLTTSAAVVPARAKFGLHWYEHFAEAKTAASLDKTLVSPFDRVVREASVSSAKLADAFKRKGVRQPTRSQAAKPAAVEPATVRIAAVAPVEATVMMAFADSSPKAESGAVAAVSAMAASHGEEVASIAPVIESPAPDAASDLVALPDTIPLPIARPEIDEPTRTLLRAKKPASTEEETKVAFAKPDDSTKKGSGLGIFRSRPKAGNGVAVYDISAAKVYMPDGTTLEAHSGIGKMADNPDYVHVKMNGPTPPHTYNLKMREEKFHGVEAIRMLPVDGKNKYGRDGFLTHSYLLRFRRAQSHGCIAFKDYDKFLAAFKAGKIRQLVVVSGGGRAKARVVASTGRDA